MKRLLLAVVVGALLSACQSPKPEPWIVTSLSLAAAGGGAVVRIEFTLPGGGTGHWQGGERDETAVDCFRNARIGKRLPDCAFAAAPLKPS